MFSLDELSLAQVSSFLRHRVLPRAFRWTGDLNEVAMKLQACGKVAEADTILKVAQHLREVTTAYNDIAWRLAEDREDADTE